jgi:hypothetical protein
MALGSTQPLTQYQEYNLGVKAVRTDNLATYMWGIVFKSWERQHSGALSACPRG